MLGEKEEVRERVVVERRNLYVVGCVHVLRQYASDTLVLLVHYYDDTSDLRRLNVINRLREMGFVHEHGYPAMIF